MTAPATGERRSLLPQHEKLIRDSAIAPEVANARGYRSATTRGELEAIGFYGKQVLVPALVIPIRDTTGQIVLHQIRPDSPRVNKKNGKLIKYETPLGARLALDVHPHVLHALTDPSIPLWFTEGSRKVDSAVSRELACVGLLGVDGWRGTNKQGGKAALADFENIALNRPIYVAFDSDVMIKKEVRGALDRFRRFLEHRKADVRLVILPAGPNEKVGIDDYFAAGGTVEELLVLAKRAQEPAPPKTNGSTHSEGDQMVASELPEIIVTARQLDDIVHDAVTAIVRANDPPQLFLRGGQVVRVRRDEDGRPIVSVIGDVEMVDALSACARWFRVSGNGMNVTDAGPTRQLAAVVLARIMRLEKQLPPLSGITETPIMREDGTIHSSEGYDPQTAVFYAPEPGFSFPSLPAIPTTNNLQAAVKVITEVLIDFPFVDDPSNATAWALLLAVNLRSLILGCVPLILIDAPMPGSGKGLLARTVTTIATGRELAMMPAPGDRDDAEWRKRISAQLFEGSAVVAIDNIEKPIYSPALASVLTATTWTDRTLGRSEMMNVPARAIWLGTGNNIRLRGDLPRRCLWCRLDAKEARPWTRSGFSHPDLVSWTRELRGELLAGVFTMARAWIAAGRPDPEKSVPELGSFEEFRRVIGGILRVAGVGGFLANLADLYDGLDDDTGSWTAFLTAWREEYGEKAITVAELMTDLVPGRAADGKTTLPPRAPLLREIMPDELQDALKDKSAAKRIGHALKRKLQVRFTVGDAGETLHLERIPDLHKSVARWKVIS